MITVFFIVHHYSGINQQSYNLTGRLGRPNNFLHSTE